MSLLDWQPAERHHRDALRTFECTDRPRRVHMPWGWDHDHRARHELVVQSLIRERLSPVGMPGRTVLLGWASDALGGVSTYRDLGSGAYNIDAIAVAKRFRHKGGGWALEAMVTTLDYITADADADGYAFATVAASIHENNRPSQRLFASQQFVQTDSEPEGYQVWSATLPVAGIFDGDHG